MTKKIKAEEINYLSFEGGGGRGVVYLGVIEALERKFHQINERIREANPPSINLPPITVAAPGKPRTPEVDIYTNPSLRQIRGISGSSAGAIMAFMLAMGLSSKEIEKEFNDYSSQVMPSSKISEINVSNFERFFEFPDLNYNRIIGSDSFSSWDVLKLIIKEFFIPKFVLKLFQKSWIKRKIQKGNLFDKPNSKTLINECITQDGGNLSKYLISLAFKRGMFPGKRPSIYFAELIDKYLLKDKSKKGGQITFKRFFELTGTDLIITGCNVSFHSPRIFSTYHTPDFMLADAVAISMNLPILFIPIFNDIDVKKGASKEYNNSYRGFYVDGGLLNNYPIHIFNKLTEVPNISFNNENPSNFWLSSFDYQNQGEFCDRVIGFRLQTKFEPKLNKSELFDALSNGVTILDFLVDLLDTITNNTEESQIRSKLELERSIIIDTGDISLVDFSNLELDILRLNNEEVDKKRKLINNAQTQTLNSLE